MLVLKYKDLFTLLSVLNTWFSFPWINITMNPQVLDKVIL